MATSDIVSPSGLDLSPAPPSPVRVSKRAGLIFLGVSAMIAAIILYGIVTRGDRQLKLGYQVEETKGLTAATDAGRVIASKVPARSTTQDRNATRTDELLVASASLRPAGNIPALPPAQTSATQHVLSQPTPPQYRGLTPEEHHRQLAYQRELEAFDAPTTLRDGFTASREVGGAIGPTPQGDISQLTRLFQTMQGAGNNSSHTAPAISTQSSNLSRLGIGMTSQSQAEEYKLQNAQDEKDVFLEKARRRAAETYLEVTRVKPLGKFEIKAGWDIPAILEQTLNSDLPGEIKALVRENVYDTATGKHLLIPQGSRLIGIYDSRIVFGQDGVQAVWNRIIFPDASSINLEGMAGQDAKGNSGLRHEVDNHYKRLIGMAVLTSAFGAAFQLSQTRRGTVFTYPSPAEIAGSAAAGNLSQLGAEITRKNLNIQPTIKVPVGYRFNVRVNRDILFDAPYRPLQP